MAKGAERQQLLLPQLALQRNTTMATKRPMTTAERYIAIVDAPPGNKTKRWHVRNTRTGELCGEIKWYGGFRAYVFYPTDGFLFDTSCLRTIADFLEEHRKDRV